MPSMLATVETLIRQLIQSLNGTTAAINAATPVPPASGGADNYIRINSAATGYEARTPSQVLGDIAGQASGANGNNVLAPTTAITLTNAQSGSIIQPAATAPITVTLPAAPVVGVNFEFIGYVYVTTVATGTASNIFIPGLAGSTSATVPANGNNSLFVFWNGNAWAAWTRGQVAVFNATASNQAVALGQAQADFAALNGNAAEAFAVANATASNQAVALGQVLNVAPVSFYGVGGKAANTTYSVSASFTAPCAGYAFIVGFWNTNSSEYTGGFTQKLLINGAILCGDSSGGPSWSLAAGAAVAAGTVTGTIQAVTSSTALTNAPYIRGIMVFVPNP